jgi:hypothetical protein
MSKLYRTKAHYGDPISIRVWREPDVYNTHEQPLYLGPEDLFVVLWGAPASHPLLVRILSPRLGIVYAGVGLITVDTEEVA